MPTATEQQKIDDINECIAQFDGWKLQKGNKNHRCDRHNYNLPDEGCTCYLAVDSFVKDGHRRYHFELKYHEDWNMLHAVWDKFSQLILEDTKLFRWHSEMRSLIAVAICYSGISQAHKLLHEAIVFYNTTKQKE